MSATVEQLEAQAAKVQQQAAEARREHDAAVQARQEREAAKRTAYWTGEGLQLAKAQGQRVQDAMADFRDAVTKGDGAQVLTAYLAYRRTAAEAAGFTRAAADATRRTVGQGLDERTVTDVQAMDPRGLPFGDLLERALRDLAPVQGSDYAGRMVSSLQHSLED